MPRMPESLDVLEKELAEIIGVDPDTTLSGSLTLDTTSDSSEILVQWTGVKVLDGELAQQVMAFMAGKMMRPTSAD